MALGLIKSAHIQGSAGLCKHNQIWFCRRTGRSRVEGGVGKNKSREEGMISGAKWWIQIRMESIWQHYVFRGSCFCPKWNVSLLDWWEVAVNKDEGSHQSWEMDSVPVSVPEPNTVHPLWLERLAPHYLPILASIWGENAVLQAHFRGPEITAASPLKREGRLSRVPSCSVAPSAPGWRHRWGDSPPPAPFFCARKSGSLSLSEMEQSFKSRM